MELTRFIQMELLILKDVTEMELLMLIQSIETLEERANLSKPFIPNEMIGTELSTFSKRNLLILNEIFE